MCVCFSFFHNYASANVSMLVCNVMCGHLRIEGELCECAMVNM